MVDPGLSFSLENLCFAMGKLWEKEKLKKKKKLFGYAHMDMLIASPKQIWIQIPE